MKLLLKDIANIQTGYFGKTTMEGNVIYLQAKHFDEFGFLNTEVNPELQMDQTVERHVLQMNDVLFASKGAKNFASLFEGLDYPTVASTSFFIIRLHNEIKNKINAEYLVWFLNHTNTQKFLKSMAKGSSIASISKSTLNEVEIPVPDIKVQDSIVKINQLRNRERALKEQIEVLQEKQIQKQILKSLYN